MTQSQYRIHLAREGFGSILHCASGEIMHSRTPPIEEARILYAQQSRLAERLMLPGEGPLVIWDVGLGAAANAFAAIEIFCSQASVRPLHIVSFENDLDPLRLAMSSPEHFPYVDSRSASALLETGVWKSEPRLEWQLVEGDFLKTLSLQLPAPDLIYYDMFSPKVAPGPWEYRTFQALAAICQGKSTGLYTYTRSTAARAGLLVAGFFVARGTNAGSKEETTIALTPEASSHHDASLLGSEWLRKWERSGAQFPSDVQPAERAAFEAALRAHPQF
jgi:queuine tRNA-ribosyltransferase